MIYSLRRETEAARTLLTLMQDILSDDDEATSSTVEGETNLHVMIARAVERLAEIDALVSAIKDMSNRIDARKARLHLQEKLLREAITTAMEVGQIKRAETPAGTISLRPSTQKVVLISEADIPTRFWKQPPPTLDKRDLLKALKDGEAIPGAALSNTCNTISVSMK